MVHIVGAGPGAVDLITVRGDRLIREADVIIYAGSLVNPALLKNRKAGCRVYDSSVMTLEEVLEVIAEAEKEQKNTVRLHTGDPSLYGAVREQMDAFDRMGIQYDCTPGVSSFCAAAAALDLEYTLPGVSQSLIISRTGGRTETPDRENLKSFAAHGSSMVLFLSAGLAEKAQAELLEGGYAPETPAAVVSRASWPDEEKYVCTLGTLAETCREHGICKTALLIIGEALTHRSYLRSELYNPYFETGLRKARPADKAGHM